MIILSIIVVPMKVIPADLPDNFYSSGARVVITVTRIVGLDDIEGTGRGDPDWYFYIGYKIVGDAILNWSPKQVGPIDTKDWSPNIDFSFNVRAGVPGFVFIIMLCEDDSGGIPNNDDYADVSDDSGQGIDNIESCSPPADRRYYYSGSYYGIYDLVSNTLSGNRTDDYFGQRKTSGEFDNVAGDQNDAEVYFTISDNYDLPISKISVSKNITKTNDSILFDGLQSLASDGSTIVNYTWNFDDGNFGYGETVTHIYSKPGIYNATLQVKDDWGNSNTSRVTITILENKLPTADFNFTPEHPGKQTTVQFMDLSNDSDGTIVSWLWDFGDQTLSTIQHPEHKYIKVGNYTVKLTVTDDSNGTSTKIKYISITNAAPVANFNYRPVNIKVGDKIEFNDTSTDSDGSIVEWYWDFGDGSTSNLRNPTYNYTIHGTYTVRLRVKDDDGAVNSTIKTIVVKAVSKGGAENIFMTYLPWIILLIILLACIIGTATYLKRRRENKHLQKLPVCPICKTVGEWYPVTQQWYCRFCRKNY